MPVYEYECQDCGPFEALQPMAKFNEPCECPDCNKASPRGFFSAPNVSLVTSATRHAHTTNERSADTPKKSNHGPGCSCCGGGAKKSGGTLYRPDGSKSFPKKRPWMISH